MTAPKRRSTLWGPLALAAALCVAASPTPSHAASPRGTMTWALHVTLAAQWLDPGETAALASPYMILYAVHDALVKPLPEGRNTPSLARSWTVSKDGLVYDFVLRTGLTFHNGDPVTPRT